MKLLIVVPSYPSKNSSAYQFVHGRVKEYAKVLDVRVFCYNKHFDKSYSFEGIKVAGGDKKELLKYIKEGCFSSCIFHFLSLSNARFIFKNLKKQRVYVWFHGSDCVSYKRRLDKINYSKEKFKNPKFIFKYFLFIFYYKYKKILIKLINKRYNTTFVFVSEWLKKASEEDLKIKYNSLHVIPSYVDFKEFIYKEKKSIDRYNILSINNYNSKIYAGDITRDVILKFSELPMFEKFKFTIYGQGQFFKAYTKDLNRFSNVLIFEKNLNHAEIKKLHDQNGIFLYPKRGDSQGVSRCEAMASGLVPIASDVEAISEFSPNNTSYLVKTVDDFINALIKIDEDEEDFLSKSRNAAKFVSDKCSYKNTIQKEINILMESD